MFIFGYNPGNSDLFPASANPWSATSVRTNPSYTYLTPAQVPAAEEMNYIFYSTSKAASAGVSVPGLNWKTLATAPSAGYAYQGFTGGGFDAVNERWLVCSITNTGHPDVLWSQGFGDYDFTSVSAGNASGLGTFTSACFDGTNYFATMIRAVDGALLIHKCAPGGAWSVVFTDAASTAYKDVDVRIFLGYIVVTSVVLGGAMVCVVTPVGGGGGGTWSAVSGAVQGGGRINVANSATLMVAFASTGLGTTAYMTMTNPAAGWTSQTPSFLGGSAALVSGVCYSPADRLFVCMSLDITGAYVHTHNSPDAITWTLVNTFTSTLQAYSVQANAAGCLVALLSYGATGFYSIYSIDAGTSWYFTTNLLGSGVAYTAPKVIASKNGFWAMSNQTARYSGLSGVGDGPLT